MAPFAPENFLQVSLAYAYITIRKPYNGEAQPISLSYTVLSRKQKLYLQKENSYIVAPEAEKKKNVNWIISTES